MKQDLKSYFAEISAIASDVPSHIVEDFRSAISDYENIDKECKDYLLNTYAEKIEYCISTLYPLFNITWRIITARPEDLFDYLDIPARLSAIYTYEDAYEILKEFPDDSAKGILNRFTENSSLRSRIIRAFENSQKEIFANELERTGEDYTNKLNSLYLLFWIYTITNLAYTSEEISTVDVSNFLLTLPKKLGIKSDVRKKEAYSQIQLLNQLLRASTLIEFIDNTRNVISIYGIDKFDDLVEELIFQQSITFYTVYQRLSEGLFQEEQNLYDGILRSSLFSGYLERIKEIVNDSQEGSPSFLPPDFFNKNNRKQNEQGCIGLLKQRIIDAGVPAITNIINFLAENDHIDDTDVSKRNWAFRLTGFHAEYALEGTNWHGEGNLLSVIIQNFYEPCDKWKNTKRLIKLESTLYRSSTLRKKNEQDRLFAELYHTNYGIDLLK